MRPHDHTGFVAPDGAGSIAPHVHLRLGERRLAFCLMREPAGAPLEWLFTTFSPHRANLIPGEDPREFMVREHRIKKGAALGNFDRAVFAYRDPLERIVSLYRDTFVTGNPGSALLAAYARDVRRPPEQASFREFVCYYLHDRFAALDPLVAPQAHLLRPDRYTDAVPAAALPKLLQTLVDRLVPDAALRPASLVLPSPREAAIKDSCDLSAATLRARWLSDRLVPSFGSLMTAHIARRVYALYRCDYDLIRSISAQNPSNDIADGVARDATWFMID